MSQIRHQVVWSTLSLRLSAQCPSSLLSSRRALDAAAQALDAQGAHFEDAVADRRVVHFRMSLRSGRSWLAMVAGGRVEVTEAGGQTGVQVQASLWPLALLSALVALLVPRLGPPGALGVGLAPLFLIGNGMFIYVGLRRLLGRSTAPATVARVA